MVPNKFEEQIKEKLNSREIQPSEMAWDRLDAMLTVAEEKKTKRSFGWLYIAASILVLVSAGMFFFNQNTLEIAPNTTIVNQEVIKDSVTDSLEKIQNEEPIEKIQPLVQVEENSSQSKINNHQASTKNNVSIIKSNQIIANKSNPKTSQIKVVENQNQDVIVEKSIPLNNKESLIKEQSNPIENKEVIALSDSKEKPSQKVTVSANSLLNQVEGELDLTFREKVFKKAKKNFKEVKVAIAHRNDLEKNL